MAIQFKVARTPQEIDDALWLRHQVYVTEEGLFGGKPLPDERIVDRFDVIPKVAHILAYDDDEPVGGIRVNCDMGRGLPPEKYFDFGAYLPSFENVQHDQVSPPPVIASAGMLVVRNGWRRRRDVTRALYRVAIGVFYSWEATHITGVVSAATVSVYRRMGFAPIAERVWNPAIGDHIVPLVARAEDCFRWAFGEQIAPHEMLWQEQREVDCDGYQPINAAQALLRLRSSVDCLNS